MRGNRRLPDGRALPDSTRLKRICANAHGGSPWLSHCPSRSSTAAAGAQVTCKNGTRPHDDFEDYELAKDWIVETLATPTAHTSPSWVARHRLPWPRPSTITRVDEDHGLDQRCSQNMAATSSANAAFTAASIVP